MNILLHMCCANCAIFPVRQLRDKNHQVTGFFFNHNIHPYQEYRRRLEAVQQYAAVSALEVIYRDEYLLEEFLGQVAIHPRSRCHYCYQSRMEETAKMAAAKGFDGFTTSLLYSRYQQHDVIRKFGQNLARRFELTFYYEDFRTGWKDGIEASKTMGLYRQQYCGCIYSEKDRYHPKSRN